MMYFVRYIYGTTIEAPSREEAFKEVIEMIEHAPRMVIASVEQANLAKPRSLLWRLLTGR